MFLSKSLRNPVFLVMWCAALRSSTLVSAFSTRQAIASGRFRGATSALGMTTDASLTAAQIVPRVKAVDAKEPSDGPVLVKGWVRTLRKQKTLAFVEVNDGSSLSGIQCVLPFDNVDEETLAGKSLTLCCYSPCFFLVPQRVRIISFQKLKKFLLDVLLSSKVRL